MKKYLQMIVGNKYSQAKKRYYTLLEITIPGKKKYIILRIDYIPTEGEIFHLYRYKKPYEKTLFFYRIGDLINKILDKKINLPNNTILK